MTQHDISPDGKDGGMPVTVLYSETPELTRWRSESLECRPAPGSASARLTMFMPAENIAFLHLPSDYRSDWRPAPRKQYVLVLDGALEVEAGTGEKRVFRPGSILLVTDTTGRGHRTSVVSAQGVLLAWVPVP